MGDMGEIFRELKEVKKEQRQYRYEKNLEILKNHSSKIKYKHKHTVCLFREKGKPLVDFYPHTGRWKVVGKENTGHVYRGGAKPFLNWYEKQ